MSPEAKINQEISWPSTVYKPVLTGFCEGVRRSIKAYDEALESLEEDEVLISVGEPAHNDRVNKRFLDLQVEFVKSVKEIPKDDRKKKIRLGPHGSTEEDIAILEANGDEYSDTVCPLVTKPLREIRVHTKKGRTVFYHGYIEKGGEMHPETRAALAAGENNMILLISNKEEFTDEQLGKIPTPVLSIEDAIDPGKILSEVPDPEKVAFVSQTTHNADEEEELWKQLKEKYAKLEIPNKNDVCYATKNRQYALVEMIKKGVKKVVIFGSNHSKNARNMVKVSMNNGVDVFFVNSAEDLNPADFQDSDEPVGIAGAASTEDETIQEGVDFFTSRGSKGPELVELYDSNGEVISEENIVFKPPKVFGAAN